MHHPPTAAAQRRPHRPALARALPLALGLGLAAAACGGGGPADDDPGADAATDAATDAAVDAPADVPMIGDALAAACGGYTPAPGVGIGDDLHKVTLTNPDAVCNDGTRAVMYIRASTGGANTGRWVFYQQGGHACQSEESCTIRYCGTEKYTKAKMSSRWTPNTANTDNQGLLDRDGVNPFGEANAVLLYYCSSDSWTGTKSDTVLADPEDPTRRYRIHFRGHTIVQAAFDQLLAGPVTSDDGLVTLPRLTTASLVVYSGSSAGAGGAEHNLDYVAGRLSGNGTTVRGVFDANLPPRSSDLDPTLATVIDAQSRDVLWPLVRQGYYGMFTDASCMAAHPPAEQWLCGDNTHVVFNHITTPFIARQDLRDAVIGARYTDRGAPMSALAGWYRATALAVPAIADDAEEADRIGPRPGIYAPNCGQHVALTSRAHFQVATLAPQPGAPGTTWRAAIIAWLQGTPIALVDTHPSSRSTCADPEDVGE